MRPAEDHHPELPVDPDDAAPDGPSGSRPLHRRPLPVLLVAVGGALGTTVRYGVSQALVTSPGTWPVATFGVNLAGAFALGLLLEALARGGHDAGWRQQVRLFAGTGFCGGLTTCSTLALETEQLVRGSHGVLAAGYVLTSAVLGVVAVAAGIAVGGHRIRRHRTRRRAVGDRVRTGVPR